MFTESTHSSTGRSPLAALQAQFARPRSVARFDDALCMWSRQDPALAEVASHSQLTQVLRTRDYARHDEVLFTLLRRAATLGGEGVVAAELVVNAMIPAVPGIVGRVIRASRAVLTTCGPRRGVSGAGVSGTEDNGDIQATVIGHLWERVRCYPLRRQHYVAANLVLDTQRAVLRSLGVDHGQAAADVVSLDDTTAVGPLAQPAADVDASEELLGLLAWAVEAQWLDEQAAAILTARYYGEHIGRDGVATDRQVGAVVGMSQPTVTRHRHRAVEQLAAAVHEFEDAGLPRAS